MKPFHAGGFAIELTKVMFFKTTLDEIEQSDITLSAPRVLLFFDAAFCHDSNGCCTPLPLMVPKTIVLLLASGV